MEKSQGDSGEFDAPSSNGDDSDDDDVNRHSPGEADEAQDSPGPGVSPANFDPDVSNKINVEASVHLGQQITGPGLSSPATKRSAKDALCLAKQ